MPNKNKQGPMDAGSTIGRGHGFCNGSDIPGSINRKKAQKQTVEQQSTTTSNHTPQGCATGFKTRNGRRSGDGNSQRGQR